ncbi:conserved hypothetical protein [Hyella patelloides LEGE 07179]|uniref:Uncharacterized protein n=1 Tax=Hyella patelloides LEGE 07179 TaxID=945734 RepID=A0A563VN82_9CYAN|nr:hypothetical protein [Hyella patelloides]VEP12916.1 conserved hypothetical protein [Hyella patelloides LEGE 07179]
MMNQSEEAYPTIELDFVQETIKRYIAKHPHSAREIALQLLAQLKEQRQKQHELEQKYDELLASYLNVNDAYLDTLRLLNDRTVIESEPNII